MFDLGLFDWISDMVFVKLCCRRIINQRQKGKSDQCIM